MRWHGGIVPKQTHINKAEPSPDVAFKGAGASKLVVGFFSVMGLFALIAAPGAGKFAGFMILVVILSTYFISGAYRVIFLPDRMRYGMFGHAEIAYGEIKQLRDINPLSAKVMYRRLIIIKRDGTKIKLWGQLPYSGEIVSQLRRRTDCDYIEG